MKKIILIILIFVLALNLRGQTEIKDNFAFSISWTPDYFGPSDGRFMTEAFTPISAESIIHYNISNFLCISTGIGYSRHVWDYESWLYSSTYDITKTSKWISNSLRFPVQISYKLRNSLKKADPYIKTEFINHWGFYEIIYYQSEIINHSEKFDYYSPEISIGIGSYIGSYKPVRFLLEGSVGNYLDFDFLRHYILRLKLGIIFN